MAPLRPPVYCTSRLSNFPTSLSIVLSVRARMLSFYGRAPPCWCLATFTYPSSYSVPLAVATRLSMAYYICYVRGMPRLQPSHPPLRIARQPIPSPDASASLWQLLAFSPSASCLPYSSPRSICPLMRTSSNRSLSRLALRLYSALSFGCGSAVVPAVDPSMIPQMTHTRALAGGAAWQRLFTTQSRW